MLCDSVLYFAQFVSFDLTLIEESIMYVQVVSYKTSNLAAVNEACLFRYTVR